MTHWIWTIFEGIITSVLLEAFMPINWGTIFFGICIILSDLIILYKSIKEGDFKLLVTFIISNSLVANK